MLEDIELLSQDYAIISTCMAPNKIKVGWKINGRNTNPRRFTKYKIHKYSRVITVAYHSGTNSGSFMVPITGPHEFIVGIMLVGVYDLNFSAKLKVTSGPMLYCFTDTFAIHRNILFKRIIYSSELAYCVRCICEYEGFRGIIKFIIASKIEQSTIVTLRSTCTSFIYGNWKYIVVKDTIPDIFTEAQLDEMWNYEYPYMKRPKNLALIQLLPTDPNIIYEYENPAFKGLNIIHMEKYIYTTFAYGAVVTRYIC